MRPSSLPANSSVMEGAAAASGSGAAAAASSVSVKEEVFVSEMPLVFAHGEPRSLESLSLAELQRFLLFVLKCESGRKLSPSTTPEQLLQLPKPKWWPDGLQHGPELFQPQKKKGLWSMNIRRAVRNCYSFHNMNYLLEFSSKLMSYMANHRDSVRIDQNRHDGTRTMVNQHTDKMLVTFRSENQDYDKVEEETDPLANPFETAAATAAAAAPAGSSAATAGSSPLRRRPGPASSGHAHHGHAHHGHLRRNGFHIQSPLKRGQNLSSENNNSDPVLPAVIDVYLCDTCDRDFESIRDLLKHEPVCPGGQRSKFSQHTPNKSCDDPLLQRKKFFSYLNLTDHGLSSSSTTAAAASSSSPSYTSPAENGDGGGKKVIKRPKTGSYFKFLSIDVTSPLGCYIRQQQRPPDNQNSGLIHLSDLCQSFNPRREVTSKGLPRINDFYVTFSASRHYSTGFNSANMHVYCFTNRQRRARRLSLETGLSERSLKLYHRCRKLRILSKRLSPRKRPKNVAADASTASSAAKTAADAADVDNLQKTTAVLDAYYRQQRLEKKQEEARRRSEGQVQGRSKADQPDFVDLCSSDEN